MGQSQETMVAKKLASWAAMLAVPTAVAGIYGMNFEYMPWLTDQYSFFTIMLAMLFICCVMYWRFRKNGWV